MNIIEVRVGAPGTLGIGSDRYGVTVVEVSKKEIVVQFDEAKNEGDYYGIQRWVHTADPQGRTKRFTARTLKGGGQVWAEAGQSWKSSARLSVGYRDSYRDPSR